MVEEGGMEGDIRLTGQCVQCAACSPAMMWQCSCPHARPLDPLSPLPYIHPIASLFVYSPPPLLFLITIPKAYSITFLQTVQCTSANLHVQSPFSYTNTAMTVKNYLDTSHIKVFFNQGGGEDHHINFYFNC